MWLFKWILIDTGQCLPERIVVSIKANHVQLAHFIRFNIFIAGI